MKDKVFAFTLFGYLMIAGICTMLNVTLTGSYPWAVYPVLFLGLVPVTVWFIRHKNPVLYSVVSTGIIFAVLLALNLINTPGTIWVQHVVFFLIWWPLAAVLGERAKSVGFAFFGALAAIAFAAYTYYTYTPMIHPWYYMIILPALWWPLTRLLIGRVNKVAYVITSVIIMIGYGIWVNMYFIASNMFYELSR